MKEKPVWRHTTIQVFSRSRLIRSNNGINNDLLQITTYYYRMRRNISLLHITTNYYKICYYFPFLSDADARAATQESDEIMGIWEITLYWICHI
jgi:hypothetical protein